jgi:hypothetical protein
MANNSRRYHEVEEGILRLDGPPYSINQDASGGQTAGSRTTRQGPCD